MTEADDHLERALREDYDEVTRGATIPSAGAMFWRASIRARGEAARKVDQPLTVATAVAMAALLGAGIAIAGVAWQTLPLAQVSHWTTANARTVVALCGAAIVVISPLALVTWGSRSR